MKEYQNLILAFFWEHPVAMMHKNYELSIRDGLLELENSGFFSKTRILT